MATTGRNGSGSGVAEGATVGAGVLVAARVGIAVGVGGNVAAAVGGNVGAAVGGSVVAGNVAAAVGGSVVTGAQAAASTMMAATANPTCDLHLTFQSFLLNNSGPTNRIHAARSRRIIRVDPSRSY